jgi:hypothetical protein
MNMYEKLKKYIDEIMKKMKSWNNLFVSCIKKKSIKKKKVFDRNMWWRKIR